MALSELLPALKDSDCEVRKKAVEALGTIGDSQALEPLLAMLEDESWYVRKAVPKALGSLGWKPRNAEERIAIAMCDCERFTEAAAEGASALSPLIEALHYDNPLIQASAAEALGKLGDGRAIAPLLPALVHPDAHVQTAAKDALRKIGYSVKPAELFAIAVSAAVQARNLEEYHSATRVLDAVDCSWLNLPQVHAAVPALLDSLKRSDYHRHMVAVRLLLRLKEPQAVKPLLKFVHQKENVHIRNGLDGDVVGQLLCWICEIPDSRWVPDLIIYLNDSNLRWKHRTIAAEALARVGTRSAQNALCRVSIPKHAPYYGDDADIEDSRNIDDALGEIFSWFARGCSGDETAVGHLEEKTHYGGGIEDVAKTVRGAASDALRRLNSLQSSFREPPVAEIPNFQDTEKKWWQFWK